MWNGGTKTCSNIACHNGKPVTWTSNDQLRFVPYAGAAVNEEPNNPGFGA